MQREILLDSRKIAPSSCTTHVNYVGATRQFFGLAWREELINNAVHVFHSSWLSDAGRNFQVGAHGWKTVYYTLYILGVPGLMWWWVGVSSPPPPSRSSPPPRFLHYCDLSNNFSWKYLYSSLSLYNEYPVKYFITLPQLLLHTQPQPVMQVTHVCINHITENPFLCILLG